MMKLRLIAAVAAVALAGGALAQQQPSEAQALSYMVGYDFAGKLRQAAASGEAIDVEWVIQGLREGVAGAQPQIPLEQLQQALVGYQQREQARAEQARAQYEQFRQQNRQKSDAFLAAYAKQSGV